MFETPQNAARLPDAQANGEEVQQTLRQMGARAHQLRAATRAADHFNAKDASEDRNTGSWLMSSAVGIAAELASDIDALARSLRERPTESARYQTVSALRKRAHQVHAIARAADHFLEQDSREDRETGSWLIAAALAQAHKLASEIDDSSTLARKPAVDKTALEPHDPALARRVAAAAQIRGAA
jgi:50S ribosomal subunit-associated GTPase HflX